MLDAEAAAHATTPFAANLAETLALRNKLWWGMGRAHQFAKFVGLLLYRLILFAARAADLPQPVDDTAHGAHSVEQHSATYDALVLERSLSEPAVPITLDNTNSFDS